MTPFNETIREIAEKARDRVLTRSSYTGVADDIESAILSAFDEFAKREPSEETKAVGRLRRNLNAMEGEPDIGEEFRAMVAQAVKEITAPVPEH